MSAWAPHSTFNETIETTVFAVSRNYQFFTRYHIFAYILWGSKLESTQYRKRRLSNVSCCLFWRRMCQPQLNNYKYNFTNRKRTLHRFSDKHQHSFAVLYGGVCECDIDLDQETTQLHSDLTDNCAVKLFCRTSLITFIEHILLFFFLRHCSLRGGHTTSATTCCSCFQPAKHQFDLKPIPFAVHFYTVCLHSSTRLFPAIVFFCFSHCFFTASSFGTCMRLLHFARIEKCQEKLLRLYKVLSVHFAAHFWYLFINWRCMSSMCAPPATSEASFGTYILSPNKIWYVESTQIIWENGEKLRNRTWRMENIGWQLGVWLTYSMHISLSCVCIVSISY